MREEILAEVVTKVKEDPEEFDIDLPRTRI
jgi:hypothetical protein